MFWGHSSERVGEYLVRCLLLSIIILKFIFVEYVDSLVLFSDMCYSIVCFTKVHPFTHLWNLYCLAARNFHIHIQICICIDKDSLLDHTLVRLLWALFSTRPWTWASVSILAEYSFSKNFLNLQRISHPWYLIPLVCLWHPSLIRFLDLLSKCLCVVELPTPPRSNTPVTSRVS